MADDVESCSPSTSPSTAAGGEADPLEYLDRVDGRRPRRARRADRRLPRAIARARVGRRRLPGLGRRARRRRARTLARRRRPGCGRRSCRGCEKHAQTDPGAGGRAPGAALGVAGREEKVAGYYHEMEHGTLDSRGVSERVLDALGEIYGDQRRELREIGEPLRAAPPAAAAPAAPAMLRKATPDRGVRGRVTATSWQIRAGGCRRRSATRSTRCSRAADVTGRPFVCRRQHRAPDSDRSSHDPTKPPPARSCSFDSPCARATSASPN